MSSRRKVSRPARSSPNSSPKQDLDTSSSHTHNTSRADTIIDELIDNNNEFDQIHQQELMSIRNGMLYICHV